MQMHTGVRPLKPKSALHPSPIISRALVKIFAFSFSSNGPFPSARGERKKSLVIRGISVCNIEGESGDVRLALPSVECDGAQM